MTFKEQVNAVLTRIEVLDNADKKDLFALFREWEKEFIKQNATDIEGCRLAIEEILLQEQTGIMEM